MALNYDLNNTGPQVQELLDEVVELREIVGEGGSVDQRINEAVGAEETRATEAEHEISNAVDAEESRATEAENAISEQMAELEQAVGTGGSVDTRIANAVDVEKTRAEAAEEDLRQLYNSLSQSKPVPVTAEEWAAMTSYEQGVIYRVAGETSYADWMYNGTTTIKMAEYDNAIDDEPTPNSNNLVKSGGIAKAIGKKSTILTFTGDGNNAVKGTLSTGLIAGHAYRFWIKNPDYSIEGITTTTSAYDKFCLLAYNNQDYNDVNGIKICIPSNPVKMDGSINSYYDVILPTEVNGVSISEWWICAYGRAAIGEEVVVIIDDITLMANSLTEKLSNGIPVAVKKEDLGMLFDEVTAFNSKYLKVEKVYGKTLSQIATINHAGLKTYKIPLDNIIYVDIYCFASTDKCGSVILDENDVAIYGVLHIDKQFNRVKRCYVTDSMHSLLYTCGASYDAKQEVLVLYPKGYNPKKYDKELGITIEVNTHESFGGEMLEFGIATYDYGEVDIADKHLPIGTNFLEFAGKTSLFVDDYATKNYYITDISGYSKACVRSFRTDSDYPAMVFLDSNMVVISRIVNPSGHDYITDEAAVPENAKYAIYINSFTVNYYFKASSQGVKGEIDSIKKELEGSFAKTGDIILTQGDIEPSDGNITNSSTHVITSPIIGGRGFFLLLNEGYKIYAAHLFDIKGNLIAYNYLPPEEYYSAPFAPARFDYTSRRFYGSDAIPANHYLIVVITNNSIGEISSNENIIEQFSYLNDGRLCSIGSDLSYYNDARKKILQLTDAKWTPVHTIAPTAANSDIVTSAKYFYIAGKTRFGIPYSEASQYTKYVGQHVSLYTFLTAIHNPRSVMYTEDIAGNGASQYDITYNGLSNVYARSYYGTVCTGLTSWVGGFKNLFVSTKWNDSSMDEYLTTVANPSADNIMPLDFIWSKGHCSVIMDILCDRYSNRKFIMWVEQTKPSPYITPYTPEMFNSRLEYLKNNGGVKVRRKISWDNIEPAPNTPYIQVDWMDYPRNINYNDDICTMYGDKPCLSTGDILWLNFNKTKGYTSIVIERKSGNSYLVVETISLAGNSNVREASNEDTYADINLTNKNYSAGLYRAKMVGSDNLASDYTYWEIIDITMSVTKNGTGIDVNFSSSNGTPYLIRYERNTGMENDNYHKELSSADVSAGSITLAWPATTSSTYTYYIKLFVEGEYGVAVKRVLYPIQ